MRDTILYICICFFLLFGGNKAHATTSHKLLITESISFDSLQKHQVKFKKSEQGTVLIDDADTDVEEELQRSDDFNTGKFNNFLVASNSESSNWYLTFFSQFQYKDYSKQFNFFAPYYGHYNPIYLEIGVLRI